jgi:Nucleotide modification associated domain 1
MMCDTNQQFETVINICRSLFEKKLRDYGASWRILRPESVTDQILIKAKRIRSLQEKKESKVGEGIEPEFIGIVNYGIIGLIQLEKGYSDSADMNPDEVIALYDQHMQATKELMFAKNHDYDEAWRLMRIESYTDLILTKIFRVKQIEGHDGVTLVSEGIDANYQDMINYALFGLIKLNFKDKE